MEVRPIRARESCRPARAIECGLDVITNSELENSGYSLGRTESTCTPLDATASIQYRNAVLIEQGRLVIPSRRAAAATSREEVEPSDGCRKAALIGCHVDIIASIKELSITGDDSCRSRRPGGVAV